MQSSRLLTVVSSLAFCQGTQLRGRLQIVMLTVGEMENVSHWRGGRQCNKAVGQTLNASWVGGKAGGCP